MTLRIWLLDIAALDADDNPVTLRYASGDYTQRDAGPVDYYYQDRLLQPALFEANAFAGALLSGSSRSGIGEATLINADGALDELADYAVDGRLATLRLKTDAGIEQVLRGTVQGLSFAGNRVNVRLRDPQVALEQPIPQNRYAGDNVLPDGVEGTADDLKGRPKPLVFGKVRNASPVLVNTAKLIYQVHDGADRVVVAVRDRGIALAFDRTATDLADLLATPPPPGEWATHQGRIALGSTPSGEVTCDVDSPIAGAGSVFEEIAGLLGFDVDAADVTALDTLGDVGLFVVEDTPAASALDRIANGVGAYWAALPDGTLTVRALAAPAETPDTVFEDWQLLALDRTATGSGANGLPVWRVTVRADRIETTQNELAASAVNPARYAAEYRDAVASDDTVRVRHPLADELVIDSPLRSLVDAQAVADALLALLKVRRDRVSPQAAVDAAPCDLQIGSTVRLNTPRLGYPRNFIVLGYRLDARRSRITLTGWG